MFRSKIYLWLLFLTLLVYSNYGQSFTYSGPSQVTIPYGSTTATATFYFTYSNLDSEHKVIYPMLNVKLDGVQLNTYNLCNNVTKKITTSNVSIAFEVFYQIFQIQFGVRSSF
mgnify:CR=1 FL=1